MHLSHTVKHVNNLRQTSFKAKGQVPSSVIVSQRTARNVLCLWFYGLIESQICLSFHYDSLHSRPYVLKPLCFREELSVLGKHKHHQSSVIVSMCMFWIKALFLFGLQTTLLDKYLRKMGVGELDMKVDFTYSMNTILLRKKNALQVFSFLNNSVMEQNHILAKKSQGFILV